MEEKTMDWNPMTMSGSDTPDMSVRGKERRECHIVLVPFVHQCYHWDCGLACVSMILKMLDESCNDVYTKDLDSLQCGESVWTIDLAYILHRHNVYMSYTTITLGVHESHHKKSFYKLSIDEDSHRVTKMFEQAAINGLAVERKSVSLEDIVCHLEKDRPLIVLVNWNLMVCTWCNNKLKKCLSCLNCVMGSYQGHYVVVCGFDRKKEIIYYKDPDCNTHDTCSVNMEQFERARNSDGTDEDILFIHSCGNRACQGDYAIHC